MKNYQISSGQIPHLVSLTADLFNKMNTEIKSVGATASVSQHIHFVADLLKELVDTAYPVKEKTEDKVLNNKIITDEEANKSLYDAYLALAKINGLPKCSILNFEEFKNVLYEMNQGSTN